MALALLLGAYGGYRLVNARCFALVGDLICRVETSQPLVALTFDDGPTAAGVGYALPILARHDARATFFLIGREVERHPKLARWIHAAGHELANHSYSHETMLARTSASYDRELARTDALLRRAGNPHPRFFRPPYGKKFIGLPLAVRRLGYISVMIDAEEPLDVGDDHRAYADRMVRDARSGSILLMHLMYRSNETARRALPYVLEGLKARGLRVVSVGELIASRDRASAHPVVLR